jgi:tetratricopeptide (TPR) repeat protein
MPYLDKFRTDLEGIIRSIDQKDPSKKDEILQRFRSHIKEVSGIGKFSLEGWNYAWRNTVYNFGTKFSQQDPSDFLKILDEEKLIIEKEKQEVLDFYYSEIEFNSLPKETCEIKLKLLKEKYAYNPEFYHSLGHFYLNKLKYDEAIEQYNFALEMDKQNNVFKDSLFNTYRSYFEDLIRSSSYEKGLEISNEIVVSKKFWDNAILHNYMLGFKERFSDYININIKIKEAEASFKEIAITETQKGQNRLIEILGFFTAIIAFIFATVSIGKNFSFNEAIIFNITLGLVLILFVITVSLFFSSKTVKILDVRILFFVILIVAILLIVFKFGMEIWMKQIHCVM